MSAEKATKLLLDLIGIDGAFYRLGSNKVSRFRTTPAKKKQCYKGSMAAIFISEFLCHDSLKKKKILSSDRVQSTKTTLTHCSDGFH